MSKPLPSGITKIAWRSKSDNSTKTKFQVRLNRKSTGKVLQYFDDLNEAIAFRNLIVSGKKGNELAKKILWDIEEGKRKERQSHTAWKERQLNELEAFWNDGKSFFYYTQQYINTYIATLPENTELEQRKKASNLGFLQRIQLVEILDRESRKPKYETELVVNEVHGTKVVEEVMKEISDPLLYNNVVQFGKLPVENIKVPEINAFVKALIKHGMKSSSIQRMVTFVSKVLNKLPHLEIDDDEKFSHYKNPCLHYDKSLLQNNPADSVLKNIPDLSEINTARLFEIIANSESVMYKDEIRDICLLSASTGMRRSEVITLRREQVNFERNTILLTKTKSKKPRTVHIDNNARQLLQSLPVHEDGRFFTLKICLFDRKFRKYCAIWNKETGKDFSFHMFRKIYISKMVSLIGASNSIFAATFLGMKPTWLRKEYSVQEQSEGIHTEEQLLRNIQHSSADITAEHYMLGFDIEHKQKLIAELKSKGEQRTAEDNKLLLEMLLASE